MMNAKGAFNSAPNQSSSRRIIVVDDDIEIQNLLKLHLTRDGYELDSFGNPLLALDFIKQKSFDGSDKLDLILVDLKMPEMTGIEFIQQAKKKNPNIPIVMLTAHASVQTAVEAMRLGAEDYIQKPINMPELKIVIERVLQFQKMKNDNLVLRKVISKSWSLDDLIGNCENMKEVFKLAHKVSQFSTNVLIFGESGTGKEVIATAIHRSSPRAKMPFIPVNCTAIPEALLESELFGHSKGAFTGAIAKRKGLFETAHHGTIFLDEIGDMPLSLQAKLLRVLQEKEIKPVGEDSSHEVDVRVIAATHRDLKAMIKEGKFREDLYYRLNVLSINLPPLRERRDDIPLLAEHFLKKHCVTYNLPTMNFSADALAKLSSMSWPGNVRELENVVERAIVFCEDRTIRPENIVLDSEAYSKNLFEGLFAKPVTLEEIEKQYIKEVLRMTKGQKEATAKILGVDRKTLYRKERHYGFVEDKREEKKTDLRENSRDSSEGDHTSELIN